ncbi:MAG: phosphotransferase [Chloroflexota bacterium]
MAIYQALDALPLDEIERLLSQAARLGLEQYPIDERLSLTPLRHNENATFRVEAQGQPRYLLRLHYPRTSALDFTHGDLVLIESELAWLEALGRETKLALPKPLRARNGRLAVSVEIAEAGLSLPCSLLHWVAGQPYTRDLESESTARSLGDTIARLHEHGSRWQPPPGFKRTRRDAAYFQEMLENLRRVAAQSPIQASDLEIFSQSVSILVQEMAQLPEIAPFYGLIHADLHKGNLLLHAGQVRPIDFSFCSFGHFTFDLAIALSDMRPELRQAALESYQAVRPLPENYARQIEGFFVGSMLGTIYFIASRPVEQEWVGRRVPQIAEDYARKYNQGIPFWF